MKKAQWKLYLSPETLTLWEVLRFVKRRLFSITSGLSQIRGSPPVGRVQANQRREEREAYSDSVTSRLQGPKERAAFQIVFKHRPHMTPIASMGVQNIRQFVAGIAS